MVTIGPFSSFSFLHGFDCSLLFIRSKVFRSWWVSDTTNLVNWIPLIRIGPFLPFLFQVFICYSVFFCIRAREVGFSDLAAFLTLNRFWFLIKTLVTRSPYVYNPTQFSYFRSKMLFRTLLLLLEEGKLTIVGYCQIPESFQHRKSLIEFDILENKIPRRWFR